MKMKYSFFLFVFLIFSQCFFSKKLESNRKQTFSKKDKVCLKKCEGLKKIDKGVKLCGVFKLSCCSGSCILSICTGTKVLLDC